MSFFKKLFGNGNQKNAKEDDFEEGDIFYTEQDGIFQLFKLLVTEPELGTYHVKGFEGLTTLPRREEIEHLKVQVHHFPIDKNGFDQPKLLAQFPVTDDDLLGYFEYIKQTQNIDEIVKYAKKFYDEALQLTNQKAHQTAIQKYSKAIHLMPNFYEAIDNRAFSFMDLGEWKTAIEGFNQSLEVNPNSLLAVFSIGESYLRLEDYPKAKAYFEKAMQLDPNHPKPKEFLALTEKLMNE